MLHQTKLPAEAIMHPLFESNPTLWTSIAEVIRRKPYHTNDRLITHGDEAVALWLVLQGWVKLSRQTPDGKDSIIGLCTQGDIFGEAALFPNANYPYTAEIVGEHAELATIPASVIRDHITKNASLSNSIMSMLHDRTAQAQLKLEHMSTLSAAQRLGCFLLKLCSAQMDGSRTIQIPVEKYVIAAYLGMKPETFSRSQQQLKPLGINVIGDRIIVSDIRRLREYVCGSCSASGNCDIEDAAN